LFTLVISFAALEFLRLVRFRHAPQGQPTAVPLTILMSLVLMAAILVCAWAMARYWHILWVESFVAVAVMVTHTFCEIVLGTMDRDGFMKGLKQVYEATEVLFASLVVSEKKKS
jgi:hypothetical protein